MEETSWNHFDVLGTPFGYIKRCRGSLLVPLDHSRGTTWALLGSRLEKMQNNNYF